MKFKGLFSAGLFILGLQAARGLSRPPDKWPLWPEYQKVPVEEIQPQEWLAASHGYIPSRKFELSENVRKKIADLGPGAVEAFALFAGAGQVRFLDRPHSKRVNDIVEYALKEAILSPFIEGDLERRSLAKRLAMVRRRAEVFLSE